MHDAHVIKFTLSLIWCLLNRERCVHKGGSQIAGNFRQYREEPNMDCSKFLRQKEKWTQTQAQNCTSFYYCIPDCARDSIYYPRQGLPFETVCDVGNEIVPIGSYRMFYASSGTAFCVDTDGYRFGPDVPSEKQCCLDSTCDLGPDPTFCNSPTFPYPYNSCTSYYLGREDNYDDYNKY
jgi:hypothetical protein